VSEDAVAYVSVIPVAKGAGKSIADQVDAENPGGKIGDSVSSGFLSKVGGIGLGLVKAVTGAVAVSGGLLAGLALAMNRWAQGTSLDQVLQDADLAAGDFVRMTKQTIDLLDQLSVVAEGNVGRTARKALEAIRRGIVAYSSVA
jgi:hypothetical protein